MIANSTELKVAARNLWIMEAALLALRKQLEDTNPALLEVTAKAYVRRIELLQADIAKYLGDHPAGVSLILPPLEPVNAVMPSSTPTV